VGRGNSWQGGGRSAVVGGEGQYTGERESGAVSDDRKLSVGFCY
jgi:hypothetical protein